MYEDVKNDNPKWMKLVDLYNERWKEKWGDDELCFTYEMRFDTVHLISKQMGFIKRLVENNKIDADKFKYHIKYEDDEREINPAFTDELIMMLSISSSPLNDLFTLFK